MDNEAIVHIFRQIVNLEEEFDENMLTGKETKECWRERDRTRTLSFWYEEGETKRRAFLNYPEYVLRKKVFLKYEQETKAI